MMKCLAAALAIAAAGCPSVNAVNTTPSPFDGPTVEFDPANSVIPFPNNLVLDPTTGKVNLPAQCNEGPTQMALRTGVLNQLDGFGTYEAAMQTTTNAPDVADAAIDMTTVAANVVMYQRTNGMTQLDPTSAQKIPIIAQVGMATRFTPDCMSTVTVPSINIVPLVPLFEKSTYTVAVLDGLANTNGVQFLPSPTWALVRQKVDPVTVDSMGNVTAESTPLDLSGCPQPVESCANANDPDTMMSCPQLAQLCGIDQLWQAHNPALTFLEGTGVVPDRSHVTVAWEVTTQTTTDPLDPTIAGSPANVQSNTRFLAVAGGTIANVLSVATEAAAATGQPLQCTTGQGCKAFLDAVVYSKLGTACAPAGPFNCTAVGEVYGAGLPTVPFQTPTTNAFDATRPIAGQWTDPVNPMPQTGWPAMSNLTILETLAFIPSGTAPAAGWPVVVFGHGLGSSKESLFVLAPQLAAAGFASIAIDFQAHGSRAVQISGDASIGCGGTPDPTVAHQCFAPFLSPNLGATRDNIRQTILDLQRLIRATKACGASGCQSANATNVAFSIDPNHIVYAGISLGGIIGSTTTAIDPDIKAGVLNVAAMGWADILENSSTNEIVCPLVDALIDAGILMGDKWNGMDGAAATGLCTTPAWKAQPGYQQFAQIGRWILDPADGANFALMLGPKRTLLMEVVNDQVVPNVATNNEGMLLGRVAQMADPETTAPGASVAITTNPTAAKWVKYQNLPAAAGPPPFPGNTFQHASLLEPAPTANMDPADNDGKLGTLRVQTDAITFLVLNH